MRGALHMVTEFNRAAGRDMPAAPRVIPPEEEALWRRLDEEERREYEEAVRSGDLAAVAKELADRAYILMGMAVAHGFSRFDEIFDAVHASNMTKFIGGAAVREDGKVLKGEHYAPPDIAPLLDPRNGDGDCSHGYAHRPYCPTCVPR